MSIDFELGALAGRQAGYLGHQQCTQLGLSEAAIRWRVTSGAWLVVRKGLYKVVGIDGSYRELIQAAMSVLPNPTVSHESAAEALELPLISRGKAVVTVHARTTHNFPDVTIHRSFDMADHHRQVVNGLWTTNAARTFVDLAAVAHPKLLASALDDALASRQVRME
ncbi:MAG: hypothetical protein ACR2ME_05040, partial [Acidimicrobiia bacterium]